MPPSFTIEMMDTNDKTNETFEKRNTQEIVMDKANVRIPPPVIAMAGICIGVTAHYIVVPLTAPYLWPAFRICCGVILGIGGLAAIGLSFSLFKRTGQKPEPWTPTPTLISKGTYRYSRNPMYVGLALFQSGIGISTGVFWITVMVLPALIAIHYLVVLPEEEYLLRKFGDEYQQYKSSVRRWF
jgi:protein-S-isoprenylcysteine O-methyltransferase Ste14